MLNPLTLLGVVTAKQRRPLADEGVQLRERIEALGIPKMYGSAPEDILNDARAWQEKCSKAGLSSGAVYERLGTDRVHISSSEILLIIDETLAALRPPAMVGG